MTHLGMGLKKPPNQKWGKDLGWASSVGLILVISTGIGLAAGVWLDQYFHTKPLWTLVLLVLGIVAGFWNIFKGLGS